MVTFPDVPLGIFLFCMCVIAIGSVQVGTQGMGVLLPLGMQTKCQYPDLHLKWPRPYLGPQSHTREGELVLLS